MFFNRNGGGGVTWLVVGLGNPGSKYESTRHNMGFLAVDMLAEKEKFKFNKLRFKAWTATVELGGEKVLVMKPQTYMNLSGEAVREAAQFYKIPPERVLVIYDDVSLPVGKLRVRPTGSAGGHNGIKNIIAHLGTQDFPRVKIGVGAKQHPDQDLADWVLSGFTASEEKALTAELEQAGEAALCILEHSVPEAANRFNGYRP